MDSTRPPTRSCASRRTTSYSAARDEAAINPAIPPPTTTTSTARSSASSPSVLTQPSLAAFYGEEGRNEPLYGHLGDARFATLDAVGRYDDFPPSSWTPRRKPCPLPPAGRRRRCLQS